MIIQTRGDVIYLRGALVENQWPAIRSAASLLLDDHPQGVIIDAGGLTEVTESGARTFRDANNFIQSQNARIVVSGMPDETLNELRRIPGLRSQLVSADSVEEARASLLSGSSSASQSAAEGAVMVPLIGAWTRALDLAAVHAAARRAELQLLYVMQIPRNQPLGVPVPDMEKEAHATLSEAERMLRRSRVRVRLLTTRARDAVDGILKFAVETRPSMLVLAYLKDSDTAEGQRFSSMATLCKELDSDLAVFCLKS